MSQKKLEDFFGLMKDAKSVTTPKLTYTPQSIDQKFSMFKQRITPSEPQKQEIRNIILDNNIASVHNSTLRPFKPLNAPKSNYDDFPPELDIPEPDPPRSLKYSILTPGDSFNRDNFFPEEKKPEITIRQLLSDNRPIARKVHDVIDLEKSYPHFEQKNWQSYEYKPPKREYVPPVLKQDLITRLYTKPKDTDERSPTRPSTAASSYQSSIDKGKIWEQPNPLVEKYKKETPKESVKERPKPAKDRDYNTDPKRAVKEAISKPAPVPQKTKEELEKELAKKRAEELAAIEEAARKKEEERRKAIKKMEQDQQAYRKKMLAQQKDRLDALLASSNYFKASDDFGLAIDHKEANQRKNTDGFIKYLISFKYHDEKAFGLQAKEVPLEFKGYNDYYDTFEALLMNEYVANIKQSLNRVVKEKGSKSLSCIMKLFIEDGQEDTNDFPMMMLKLKKNDAKEGEQLVSYKDKDQNELFDLSFAKHYLIIISNQAEIKMEDINKENFKTGFTMLAYLNNQDKKNAVEIPRALIPFEFHKVRNHWKKEWVECYVHPVEKLSTFLREFISLRLFISCDVNRNIYAPKLVSNIIEEQNAEFFQKFFGSISNKYNPGQLEAIKAVCMARNGICLLQGPPGTGKTHTLVGIVSGIYHYLKNSGNTHRKYMMICTPSNAAIDEIIVRIKTNGLYNENGQVIKPNLVRVGILDGTPHEYVRACALENLVQQEMRKKAGNFTEKELQNYNEIKENMIKVQKQIQNLEEKSDRDQKELESLYEKRRSLFNSYQEIKLRKANDKEKYSQILDTVLYSADIICCTLSSAGSDKLDRFRDYIEAVIVDEASQCTEPSNIIPLQYSPKKLILIGDPKQLPATTFSTDAHTTKFNRSLFERILESGVEPFFLAEQYRMAPNIRKFPSLHFYNDRLIDAKVVSDRSFPGYLSAIQHRNVFFIDLKFSKESNDEKSYFNKCEIEAVTHIVKSLVTNIELNDTKIKNQIGCISPYKKQVLKLSEELKQKIGNKWRTHATVNTVDSFQGQEKDVIIFSAVRACHNLNNVYEDQNLIGFLTDVRRLNVAITRPRFVLFVVGNSDTLATNGTWASFINYMASNDSYISIPSKDETINVLNLILKGEKISNHLKKYVHIDRKFKKRPVDDGTEEGEVTPKGKKTSSDSTEASEVDKVPIKRKVFSPKSELIEEPAIAKKVHKEPRMSFVLKKEEEDPIDYEKDIKIKKTPQKSTEKKERNTPETPEEKRKKLDLEPKPPKANFDSLLTSLLDDGKPKQQQPRLSSNLEALFKRNENGKISSGSKPVNSRFKDDYDIENDIVGRLFKGYD